MYVCNNNRREKYNQFKLAFPTRLQTHNQIADGRNEIYGGEEVSCQFVVACCKAPKAFDPAEHALNSVSVPVKAGENQFFQRRLALLSATGSPR